MRSLFCFRKCCRPPSIARIVGIYFVVIFVIWCFVMSMTDDRGYSSRPRKLSVLLGNPDFYDSETINRFDFVNSSRLLIEGEQQVEALLGKLRSTYVSRVRRWIFGLINATTDEVAKNSMHLVQYRCDTPWKCGGLGDRLRGIVSVFYIAVFSDSVFDCDWTVPDTLGNYFAINHKLFGLQFKDRSSYWSAIVSSYDQFSFYDVGYIDSENELDKSFTFFTKALQQHLFTRVRINSLLPIQKMKKIDNFQAKIRDYGATNYSNQVLVSAALRFIFGNPEPQLTAMVESTITAMGGSSVWKVGIQLRLEKEEWQEDGRVSYKQIHCFVKEAKRLILEECPESKTASIFISSDTKGATSEFIEKLKKIWQPSQRQFPAITTIPGNVTHLDRTNFKGMPPEAVWQLNTKLFSDWLLLTRMDLLIISRSGFAETAAVYSMKPTRRFFHQTRMLERNYSSICIFENYHLKTVTMEPS